MANEKNPTKVVTKKALVRFSYAHVFKPTKMEGETDDKLQYSVSILIPKKEVALIKEIRAKIKLAAEAAKSKWGGKVPANLKICLKDGDVDKADDDNYAGMMYINARSKQKPGVVDREGVPISSEDEFYSGCWGRVSFSLFGYNTAGSKGVGAGLNHVQKIKDGERLGGRSSAEEDFDDEYEGDDANEDNEEEESMID